MKQKHITLPQASQGYGALFGALAGAFYALCLWGNDALVLAGAHAYFPFLKLILGILCYALIFGAAGWVTIRLERAWVGLIAWVLASWPVAWLMLYIPLKLTPLVMGWLKPDLQPWLNYPMYSEFNVRFLTGFFILAVFAAFLGLFEIFLVEQAAHAVAFLNRAAPFMVCLVAMVVAGLIMDELINQQLRGAIVAVDRTIEFTLDHQGEEIDLTTSRLMHLAALNQVQDLLDRPRHLVIGNYDETFGMVEVLVDFDGEIVDCMVFYDQLGNCKPVSLP